MKKNMLMLALLAVFSASAMAASLQNKDSSSYDISIKNGGSTSKTSINGGTIKSGICSSCTIEVKGVGTVSISGSDKAVIKNGSISVE